MKQRRRRALVLAATSVVAVGGMSAAGTATAAAATCEAPVVTIQAPASLAPVSGNLPIQARADSGTAECTVTSASVSIKRGATVAATPVAAVAGAPTTHAVTAAFDTRTVTDGTYTIEVGASGSGGSSTPAAVDVVIDNTAPALSFTAGPAEGAALTDGAGAGFSFSAAADLTGPVAFQCAYDSAALSPCAGSVTAPALEGGTHSFRVVGTDRAGNSAALTRSFKVTAPSVTAQTVTSGNDQPKSKKSCRVPRLRGLSLAAAKRKLTRAGCRLGRVLRPPARILALPVNRGQRLVVQRQSLKAGAKRPNGQPVGIALVPRRDLKLG
jgi:hypothetical protein